MEEALRKQEGVGRGGGRESRGDLWRGEEAFGVTSTVRIGAASQTRVSTCVVSVLQAAMTEWPPKALA